MRKLTYTNPKGASIEFYLRPFLIESLSGIGEVGANVQGVSSPFQDGDTYIDTTMQPRYIDMEGAIAEQDLQKVKDYRNLIIRVCNPKLGLGTITLDMDGTSQQIKGTLDSVPVFPERGRGIYQRFSITFKCPNPYWTDATDMKKSLAAYRESLLLPFEMPALMGVEGQSGVLVNDGHVATPIHIEFYGPSTNPVITNKTTGEFIKVYRELRADEKLIIDTGFNRKRVVIEKDGVETNAYGYVDWFESDFITLIPGENSISYKADVGTEDAIVSIEYRQRYLGI